MKRLLQIIRSSDRTAAVALLYTGALLCAFEYWFIPRRIQERLDAAEGPYVVRSPISLEAGITWAAACVVGYLVIPLLLQVLVHRRSPAAMGFRMRGAFRHLPLYLLLYGGMLPLILWAAERDDFQRTYPFVRDALRSVDTFVRWELAYVIQFFALEAFFRGYLLFSLEKRMGGLAAFVMAVPYAMIHFHKPPLEAFGALLAGVVLGLLALRFRSFLGGAVLHSLVAVTMDFLAARQAGLF